MKLSVQIVALVAAISSLLPGLNKTTSHDVLTQDSRPASAENLVVPKGTIVPLTIKGDLNVGEKPAIVAAEDVIIDGVRVVARGTPAQYALASEPPGLLNTPGEVTLEVTGVAAVSGDIIPLSASQAKKGEPACVGEDCLLLPLFFWKHGDPGKMKVGLLFTAEVAEDVFFNCEAFSPAAIVPNSGSARRLHIYQTYDTKHVKHWEYAKVPSDVFLDGKRIGTLVGNQYACVQASPGAHTLRVNHAELTFETNGYPEVHIRVVILSVDRADRVVTLTNGYQLDSTAATPGRFKRQSAVSCFDPRAPVSLSQDESRE